MKKEFKNELLKQELKESFIRPKNKSQSRPAVATAVQEENKENQVSWRVYM